jgi:hypothetical protein
MKLLVLIEVVEERDLVLSVERCVLVRVVRVLEGGID